jgi:hypothetical protein
MMLTCPTCRSGLQVPDGTTAMVRCPACKSVFSPADGGDAPESEDEREDKPRKRRPEPESKAGPARTRKKPESRERKEEDKERDEPIENRDFDPAEPDEKKARKKKPHRSNEELDPREKAAIRSAFDRGAWGCKLLWISFGMFVLSMMTIIGFWFQAAFSAPNPTFLVAAGAFGVVNWSLAAVGIGLCLSGPVSPGHWRYGIAAAVAALLHIVLLLVLVTQGRDSAAGTLTEATTRDSGDRWGLLPTRLDTLTYYLTYVLFQDQELIPKVRVGLSIAVGALELIRNVFILMLLSCLARAAGDDELSHQCTRAAGFASLGPGALAIIMAIIVGVLVETNSQYGAFTKIVFYTVLMSAYAVLSAAMFPSFLVARDTADACDEPFKSRNTML